MREQVNIMNEHDQEMNLVILLINKFLNNFYVTKKLAS
jgi:hypothetical protein